MQVLPSTLLRVDQDDNLLGKQADLQVDFLNRIRESFDSKRGFLLMFQQMLIHRHTGYHHHGHSMSADCYGLN